MTSRLRFAFVGDDFTGSTDALELLAAAGLRTRLFTAAPTDKQLADAGPLDAIGIATQTRAMPPDEIDRTLRPILDRLKTLGVPTVHYKVCSTFDSSPTVGSIGRAIDVGADVFDAGVIPVVGGTPSLGRFCVFGQLFARLGSDGDVFRIDRHPSMSRHPTTPMNEADLRIHLSKQTTREIRSIDFRTLESDVSMFIDRLRSSPRGSVVLLDALNDLHLSVIGRGLDRLDRPAFVVGPSGVESALVQLWREQSPLPDPKWFVPSPGPSLIACGSCSPVSMAQIDFAIEAGVDSFSLEDAGRAAESISSGKHALIHTRSATQSADEVAARLGESVANTIRRVRPARLIVAGGDSSGAIARALKIESMKMAAPFVRGAPWCRVRADGPADGLFVTFKGGQVGSPDFFVKAVGH